MPKETINEKTFTKDVRKLINDLAWIYNLELEELKNIILSSLNSKNMIDKTTLRKNARNYYQYQNNGKLPSLIFHNQPEYLRKNINDNVYKIITKVGEAEINYYYAINKDNITYTITFKDYNDVEEKCSSIRNELLDSIRYNLNETNEKTDIA